MCLKSPKRKNSDTITNLEGSNPLIEANTRSAASPSEKKTVRLKPDTSTDETQIIRFEKRAPRADLDEADSYIIDIQRSVERSYTQNTRSSNMESTTNIPSKTNSTCSTTNCANVVTIPVPIVHNEGTFYYITVKASLHDRSCSVFGLNAAEVQAISKRFENGVQSLVNGIMIGVPPMVMLNTLSQLSYKVVCSSGEAEICWTMQREV